jgi:hypothetical protein
MATIVSPTPSRQGRSLPRPFQVPPHHAEAQCRVKIAKWYLGFDQIIDIGEVISVFSVLS